MNFAPPMVGGEVGGSSPPNFIEVQLVFERVWKGITSFLFFLVCVCVLSSGTPLEPTRVSLAKEHCFSRSPQSGSMLMDRRVPQTTGKEKTPLTQYGGLIQFSCALLGKRDI